MLVRSIDGQLILLKRSEYLTDKQYYQAVYKIINLYTEKYNSFNLNELKNAKSNQIKLNNIIN